MQYLKVFNLIFIFYISIKLALFQLTKLIVKLIILVNTNNLDPKAFL